MFNFYLMNIILTIFIMSVRIEKKQFDKPFENKGF
jgi:hypothetical protein